MPVSAGKRGVLGGVATALLLVLGGLFLLTSSANAASGCPPIKNKPNSIPHVDYNGVEHLTYCVPATVDPGQNIIRLHGTNLFPKQPGYITRFPPGRGYLNPTPPPAERLLLPHPGA